MYTCHIQTRDYDEWLYKNERDIVVDIIEEQLNGPITYKLFHGDMFQKTDEQTIQIIKSPVRENKNIPGILLLENNRTYGRTDNKKRLYYKCKPNDPKLPYFLVPYELPMGFQKNFKNKYVTFSFHSWQDKHPSGILSQNIGDTFDLPSFNEYQLYCKQLHNSITPSIHKVKEQLNTNTVDYYQQQILNHPEQFGTFSNRYENGETVFSIDPKGCLDRDDAISIVSYDKHDMIEHVVSVYISNVWVWLEAMDLWDVIGSRVSTIYFPETKRPMLPTSIGEQMCSLDENQLRFAFVMDFHVMEHPKKGIHIQYLEGLRPNLTQCVVKVYHNFEYEERALLKCKPYQQLNTLTKKLDSSIVDSHDVVAYWMTQMNYYVAKHMKFEKMGIYRTVQSRIENTVQNTNHHANNNSSNNKMDTMPSFVRIWEQQVAGKYAVFQDTPLFDLKHEILGFPVYVHFTSPIRRMVDLLNQLLWIQYRVKPEKLRQDVVRFYEKQASNIEELNRQMKSIRRIQADAHILHKVTNEPEILERVYDAIVLSTDEKTTLYIEKLEWLTQTYVTTPCKKYEIVKCKLYVFEKEEQMRKKIRVQIVS
jgi:exoribonuclease R